MADRMIFRGQNVEGRIHLRVARLILPALSILSSLCCYAEDLPDPTRPPANLFAPAAGTGADAGSGGAPSREKIPYRPSGLHTIIVSESRRAAIIDGHTVELGGLHGNARLVEINEGNVVLQRGQSRQVLALFPDVKIGHKKLSAGVASEKGSQNKELKIDLPPSSRDEQHQKQEANPAAHKEEE